MADPILETLGSQSPVAPANDAAPSDAERQALMLSHVLVVDHRILIADTDPASDLTRQMSDALSAMTVQDWMRVVCDENAA